MNVDGSNQEEASKLGKLLAKELTNNTLNPRKYFLGIGIARSFVLGPC